MTRSKKKEVVLPMIHLNGSGIKNLMEQYRTACEALSTAEEAMAAARPHGRDYYSISDEAFSSARDQHFKWEALLSEVKTGMEAILIGIHNGGWKREN